MYTGGIGLVVRTASELEGVREGVHWRVVRTASELEGVRESVHWRDRASEWEGGYTGLVVRTAINITYRDLSFSHY